MEPKFVDPYSYGSYDVDKNVYVKLPAKAIDFISEFDQGYPVKAFEFEV